MGRKSKGPGTDKGQGKGRKNRDNDMPYEKIELPGAEPPPPPPTTSLNIVVPQETVEITHNTFKWTIVMDAKCSLSLNYGTTMSYGSNSTEPSLSWGDSPLGHRMTIFGLTPETEYFWEATLTDASSNVVVLTGSDTTIADPGGDPPVTGGGTSWTETPVISNLGPQAGYFFGRDIHGSIGAGNKTISMNVGVSMVCACDTANIIGGSLHARQIGEGDLAKWPTNSAYKALYDAGFYDPREAAFGMWNPYSKGNVTLYAELYECLPDSHLPDITGGPVVAGNPALSQSFWDHSSGALIEYLLPQAFTPVRGKRYCMCFINKFPEPFNENPWLKFNTPSEAAAFIAANPYSGATGINGSYITMFNTPVYNSGTQYFPTQGPNQSPFLRDDHVSSVYSNDGANWQQYSDVERHVPYMSFLYSDNLHRGALMFDVYDTSHTVSGPNKMRLRFTPSETFSVRGLWIAIGYDAGATPNGSPLVATLKQNTTTLRTANYPVNTEQATANRVTSINGVDVSGWARNSTAWEYQEFSSPQQLNSGTEYIVELSANAGSAHKFYFSKPIHGTADAGMSGGDVCEITSGGSWSAPANGWSQSIGWMFTLVGGPDMSPDRVN